jgi:hypothetical protein
MPARNSAVVPVLGSTSKGSANPGGGTSDQASSSDVVAASSSIGGTASTPTASTPCGISTRPKEPMRHAAGHPCAVTLLLPHLSTALDSNLPFMDSSDLADTADGLLLLMTHRDDSSRVMSQQMTTARVVQWAQVVTGSLESRPHNWSWGQLQRVLAFLVQVPAFHSAVEPPRATSQPTEPNRASGSSSKGSGSGQPAGHIRAAAFHPATQQVAPPRVTEQPSENNRASGSSSKGSGSGQHAEHSRAPAFHAAAGPSGQPAEHSRAAAIHPAAAAPRVTIGQPTELSQHNRASGSSTSSRSDGRTAAAVFASDLGVENAVADMVGAAKRAGFKITPAQLSA